jgi:sigma-B regulation protein RsbU (phosphoserine phosphatase)
MGSANYLEDDNSIHNLLTISQIVETLNRAVDMQGALELALARILELLKLETAWIFLKDPSADDLWDGRGYVLAAQANLPPAMALDNPHAWNKGCECQGLCDKNRLSEAYNEVRCSRLETTKGDTKGLLVHASIPLGSAGNILGILNVAAEDWSEFDPQSLKLLTEIGNHIGVALERARSFDLLRKRRIDEQQALLNLTNQLLTRSDLGELIRYLMDQMPTLLDTDACALLLPDENQRSLSIYAADGWETDLVSRGWKIPIGEEGVLYDVMHHQRMVAISESAEIKLHPPLDEVILREGFNYLALMPMISETGTIGAMMINTRDLWEGVGADLQFLRLLSNQAAIAIEKARFHQIELAKQRMESELELSKKIQLSMLPKELPSIKGWDFSACYLPARQISGDFYDWFLIPNQDELCGIVIADVVDKGIPAALYMALSRTMIRSAALSGVSTSEALILANQWILRDSQADLFLSAFYALINLETGQVRFTNAGHNRPLWVKPATKEIVPLSTPGIVLGCFEEIRLGQGEIFIEEGDYLVFYTDGITDALNESGEDFGLPRFQQAISDSLGLCAGDMVAAILRAVHDFTHHTDQSDDMTLVCVHRHPC